MTTIAVPDGSERCECGRYHSVNIEEIRVGEEALEALTDFCRRKGWTKAVVVMDANTEEVAGRSVARSLTQAGINTEEVVFPQRHDLLADHQAVDKVTAALRAAPEAAAVVVGSGTLTDVVRYSSHAQGRRFVSVPTAASMDGYASGMAAMQFSGMKVSFEVEAPVAIFADPTLITSAPAQMAIWGLGDLLGKASARIDWLAAHHLYGERFCPAIAERAIGALRGLLDDVPSLLKGAPEPTALLLSGLIESGIAMAMMGNSRPASGSEHHASHFWDLLAFKGVRRHAPHGLQVGYATGFTLRLQRFAFGGGLEQLQQPRPELPYKSDPEALELFATNLSAVDHAEGERGSWLAGGWEHFTAARQDWNQIRAVLIAELDTFSAIDDALEQVGIPRRAGFAGVDEARLRQTFRQANRLRARYTVLDFLIGQGATEAATETVLQQS